MNEDQSRKQKQKILPIREGISIHKEAVIKPFLHSQLTSLKLQKRKIDNPKELYRRRKDCRDLLTATLALIDLLEQTLINQSYAIFLTDKEGYIVEFRGDSETHRVYQNNDLNVSFNSQKNDISIPYNMWTNNSQGPVIVEELEHYTMNVDDWVCCGVPIRDPDEKLIGLLEVAVPNEAVPPHTLAILLSIARTVEYELSKLTNANRKPSKIKKLESLVLSNIRQVVLAMDKSFNILYINNFGLEIIGLPEEDLLESSLFNIFPFDMATKNWLNSILIGQQEDLQRELTISLQQQNTDFVVQVSKLINDKGKFIGLILVLY